MDLGVTIATPNNNMTTSELNVQNRVMTSPTLRMKTMTRMTNFKMMLKRSQIMLYHLLNPVTITNKQSVPWLKARERLTMSLIPMRRGINSITMTLRWNQITHHYPPNPIIASEQERQFLPLLKERVKPPPNPVLYLMKQGERCKNLVTKSWRQQRIWLNGGPQADTMYSLLQV